MHERKYFCNLKQDNTNTQWSHSTNFLPVQQARISSGLAVKN
jgi:hypothetical protein